MTTKKERTRLRIEKYHKWLAAEGRIPEGIAEVFGTPPQGYRGWLTHPDLLGGQAMVVSSTADYDASAGLTPSDLILVTDRHRWAVLFRDAEMRCSHYIYEPPSREGLDDWVRAVLAFGGT